MTTLINHNRRKAAIFLLILFIVFGFLSYKQEAEAIAPAVAAVAVVGIAVVGYALVTAGLTFATTGDAEAAAEACYTQFESNINTAIATGSVVWDATKQGYFYVVDVAGDVWDSIKSWVDANYNVGDNTIETTTPIILDGTINIPAYGTTVDVYNSGNRWHFLATPQGWQLDVYNVSTGTLLQHVGSQTANTPLRYYYDSMTKRFYYGDQAHFSSVTATNNPYIVGGLTEFSQAGVTGQTGIVDNPNYDWQYPNTGTKPIDIPLVGSPGAEAADFPYTNAQGDEVGLNVDQNVLEDVIAKTADDVIGAQVGTDGRVIVQDTTTTLTDEATDDYTEGQNTQTDETTKSLKFLLFTKFPFCLPWDMVNAVRLIAAAPEAPSFDVDLLAPLGVQWIGKGHLTMDMEDYAIVGTVIRWASTVEFCWMLILATRKLIWG